MIKTFYNDICEELQSIKVGDEEEVIVPEGEEPVVIPPFFKEVGRYNAQMANIKGENIKLPAVFIEFKPIRWQTLKKNVKIADVNFVIHILLDSIKHADIREEAYEKVHAKLDGLRGDYYLPIDCVDDSFDGNHAQILEDTISFTTTVEHETIEQTSTIARPIPVINDIEIVTPPLVNLTKVLNSIGTLIKELIPGEWFYIPKHKIKDTDGNILLQQEYNEDFTVAPVSVNNSIGELIENVAPGGNFNIPKHNILKADRTLLIQKEFNEHFTMGQAAINNSEGVLVINVDPGDSYYIPKHNITKEDGTLVSSQEYSENFAIQNTVVNDQGVNHDVAYGDGYTCSTLQQRAIYIDFSQGKTINITCGEKQAATYTEAVTTLTATYKKNGITASLPFTLAISDILTVDVTTNGTLELRGEHA